MERLYNEYDRRLYVKIHEEAGRLAELDRLQWMKDLAEVINVAYIGSQPGPKKNKTANSRQLMSWMREKQNLINKLLNRSRKTVWERLRGKARVF